MIVNRIKEYLENKGIPINRAEKEVGLSTGSLSKPISGGKTIKTNTLEKFLNKYNDINPEWLLTGTGEMLKSAEPEQNMRVFKQRTDRLVEHQEIPLYDFEATAGIIGKLDNGKHIPVDTIKIPNMPKADGAVFVTGDSMYPLLKSGDIVIFKRIYDIPNDIFWGEMYIVSMNISDEEYVTVKYVQKSDKGEKYIKLVGLNQHHQPKDIPLNRVRAMALVKASIRFNTMN